MTTYRKKMIEVALPLDAINKASSREKSIRHGHPSTLHLWWARRPLAACRAVLFSSLVNDPSDDPMYGIDEDTASTERAKLFDLIEDLVLWENSNNPDVINRARLEIARSIAANKVADGELEDDAPLVASAPELPEEQAKYLPDPPSEYTAKDVRFKMPSLKPEQVNHFLAHYAPPVLDPFAGGGSIPLEAQRLGLRAYASDLNPVPVLINKALIEIPPKFAGQPPVNPEWQEKTNEEKAANVWTGAKGLAEDVRYYGKWMRKEAEKRIGHLYPKVKVTQQIEMSPSDMKDYLGQTLDVLAWLWARTVTCPNPACRIELPLFKSYALCTKPQRPRHLAAIVDRSERQVRFSVQEGKPDVKRGTVARSGAKCVACETQVPFAYIREEGKAGRMGEQLLSIIAIGNRGRVYLPATEQHVAASGNSEADWSPDVAIPNNPFSLRPPLYGGTQFSDLHTRRQLVALSTFATIAKSLNTRAEDPEYARAIRILCGMNVSRLANRCSNACFWDPKGENVQQVFARQAIAMAWDFVEANPLGEASGSFLNQLTYLANVIDRSPRETMVGQVQQQDAASFAVPEPVMVSTDPPYYDNIDYADLSDFFYVWLRRILSEDYPKLMSTVLVPKSEELVATPYRFDGDRTAANQHFRDGIDRVLHRIRDTAVPQSPATIIYAFKQSEEDDDGGRSSTGWETFLQSVVDSHLEITGTWPLRTEYTGNLKGHMNVLASSVVLVVRPRAAESETVTRRDFANALRKELPEAIKHLQSGNVAPVDLAQASIGPGMAVFSRYSKVVNADGSPMSVREALQLINQVLDESLVEQESDFDAETRFALNWFEQYGMDAGPFGDAETLAKAKAVSVGGIEESGIAKSGSGKFRLLKRDELEEDWDPRTDQRLVKWEITQHLIKTLETDGETGAASLLKKVGPSDGEIARELAYRLYQTCEKKKLAEEARAYNTLVVSWPEILKLSAKISDDQPKQQTDMFKKK